jgi:hypothetical protein
MSNPYGWAPPSAHGQQASGIARYYLIRRSDSAGSRIDDTTQPLYGLDDI